MKKYKIIDVEIIDHNLDLVAGNEPQPSLVSIYVTIELTAKKYAGKKFGLNYQTTNTYDVGAYSSRLAVNDQSGDDSDDIMEILGEEDASEFFDSVLIRSQAQQKWIDYINDNYQLNTDAYRGIDANSEINEMIKK